MELESLTARDANRFVLHQAGRFSPFRCKLVVTALRSFLRHPHQRGDVPADPAPSLVPFRNWRLSVHTPATRLGLDIGDRLGVRALSDRVKLVIAHVVDSAQAHTLRETVRAAAGEQGRAAAGAYLLRTSHVDWDPARVLRTYWELSEVEATFRSLKSELGLRPIWHHLDRRVCAHLFVAVLAYHAVHLPRTRLKAHGLNLSWQSIRDRLANWVRITTTLQDEHGQPLCGRQDVRPGADAY